MTDAHSWAAAAGSSSTVISLRKRRAAATRAHADPAARRGRTPPRPRRPSTRPRPGTRPRARAKRRQRERDPRHERLEARPQGRRRPSRERSWQRRLIGEQRRVWPSGPIPSSSRSNAGGPRRRQRPLVGLGAGHRVRARPGSGGRRADRPRRADRAAAPVDHPIVRALVVGRRRSARRRTSRSCASDRCRPSALPGRDPRRPRAASTRRPARCGRHRRPRRRSSAAHTRAGILDDLDLDAHAAHSSRAARERRPVGRDRAAAPGARPRRGSRPRRERRRAPARRARCPSASARCAHSPPRPGRATARSRRSQRTVTPARPGTS